MNEAPKGQDLSQTNGEDGTDQNTLAPSPNPAQRPRRSRLSFLRLGLRSVLSGQITPRVAALEYVWRCRVALSRRQERRTIDSLASEPASLRPEFQKLSSSELLSHFRDRDSPSFLPGFGPAIAGTVARQQKLFPAETARLIASAELMTTQHRWPLMGLGELDFGNEIDWNRDPHSGRVWPLDFHADVVINHLDGSDIRVLWELNRLAHFVTLGRAYAITHDERFAEEFFNQLESWRDQNPVGRGANWLCAMEVALRAMNLLAAFTLFRGSSKLDDARLKILLTTFDQHGAHTRRNLEFSNVVTSNHYLSDVTGLLWLGIMLPELNSAREWRDWARAELLREMDKQILPDGADYEASTGYHRLVLELFLYSFVLCRANDVAIDERYWQKLLGMLGYVRGILRPDGLAPLIGDTDGGQVLPIVNRNADDHAYLLALGAVLYHDPTFKLANLPIPEELLWTLGEAGVREYETLTSGEGSGPSQAFSDSGTYLMRKDDLYLVFNAGGAGVGVPGSHGHNDALAIEVSACGTAFIVDPGTYVYNADLRERHLFRSTAYHSTVQIDGREQNTTNVETPFLIGKEAHSRVLHWETTPERDYVVAEHAGYGRFAAPVTHRRTITFEKSQRWWLVEDELTGDGEHKVEVRFHFNSGLEVETFDENAAVATNPSNRARLFVYAIDLREQPGCESQFTSNHYLQKRPSVTACWAISTKLPRTLRWALVPVCSGESVGDRLRTLSLLVSAKSTNSEQNFGQVHRSAWTD